MEDFVRFFFRFCACIGLVLAIAGSFAWKSRIASAQTQSQSSAAATTAALSRRETARRAARRRSPLAHDARRKSRSARGRVGEQIVFLRSEMLFVDDKGNFLPEHAASFLKNGIGEISRPSEHRDPRVMVEFTNSIQKWVKENTRLGIPVLFHDECLHGHVAPKGTSYPTAIALASTWDPDLLHEDFHRHRRRSPRPRHPAMPRSGPRSRS